MISSSKESMVASYKTTDGDRIDLIVLDHYGDLEMLQEVIEANPILHRRPMTLEEGISITLPPKREKPKFQPPADGVALW